MTMGEQLSRREFDEESDRFAKLSEHEPMVAGRVLLELTVNKDIHERRDEVHRFSCEMKGRE